MYVCNKCLITSVYVFEFVANFAVTMTIDECHYNAKEISQNFI